MTDADLYRKFLVLPERYLQMLEASGKRRSHHSKNHRTNGSEDMAETRRPDLTGEYLVLVLIKGEFRQTVPIDSFKVVARDRGGLSLVYDPCDDFADGHWYIGGQPFVPDPEDRDAWIERMMIRYGPSIIFTYKDEGPGMDITRRPRSAVSTESRDLPDGVEAVAPDSDTIFLDLPGEYHGPNP